METCSPNEKESNNVDENVRLLNIELQKSPSTHILELIKSIKAENIKTWTKDQWTFVLNIIETKLKPENTGIQDLLRFVEWLQPIISKTSFGIYCVVLIFIQKLIIRLLSHVKDPQQTSIKEADIKTLIMLGLRILADSKITLVQSFTMDEYNLLEKVFVLFSKIAIQKPSFVDIKTILEIWKSSSNIFAVYVKRATYAGLNMNRFKNALVEPVRYLFQEVGRNISLISRIQALQQPIEQVDKYLRVTNFYLKILRQLVAGMKHEEFVAPKEFFESHKKSKLLPNHLIGTEIADLLDKYVENSFDVLLSDVYKHPDIFKSLIAFINENSSSQIYALIDTYLYTIISNEDGNFIAAKTTDFLKIFEACFKDSKFRLDSQFYDAIIIKFSALTMLDETPNLLNHLRENVLKDNFWIAAASTEILISIQRYQHKHLDQFSNIFLKEFEFWRDCYSKFSLFSSDLKQTHIVRLLKNCLELDESKSNIQLNNHTIQLSSENYRLILATDLSKNFQIQTSNINNEFCELLNQLATGNSTVHSYYKTIVYMKLLESFCSTYNNEAMNILEDIIKNLLKSDLAEWRPFSLFLSSSLKLIAKFVNASPTLIDAEKFLTYLNMTDRVTVFPGSLILLYVCSENSSQEIRQRANMLLKQSHIDSTDDITFESITKIIEFINSRKYNHNCLETYSPEQPERKRKCFDFKY